MDSYINQLRSNLSACLLTAAISVLELFKQWSSCIRLGNKHHPKDDLYQACYQHISNVTRHCFYFIIVIFGKAKMHQNTCKIAK